MSENTEFINLMDFSEVHMEEPMFLPGSQPGKKQNPDFFKS